MRQMSTLWWEIYRLRLYHVCIPVSGIGSVLLTLHDPWNGKLSVICFDTYRVMTWYVILT
jgi:hypothetical protein